MTNTRANTDTTPGLRLEADLSVEPDVRVQPGPSSVPGTRGEVPDYGQHDVLVKDEGSFTVARCTCGWRSYARRSRDLARSEGLDHSRLFATPTES